MAFGTVIEQRKTAKRNHVIGLFREKTHLSKAEVRQLSGYSMETLIGIFRNLEDSGLLCPSEVAAARLKGRPSERYRLNPLVGLYLGVTFTSARLHLMLVNLSLERLSFRSVDVPDGAAQDEFERFFTAELARFAADNQHHLPAIRKIALALPGQVDPATGVLRHYGLMPSWRNLDLASVVTRVFGAVPLVVRHNIAGYAREVLSTPALRDFDGRILYVTARSGTAHALLQQGKIVLDNGEMGHLHVSQSNLVCECGRTGCLDTIFSLKAIGKLLPGQTLGDFGHHLRNLAVAAQAEALAPLETAYQAFSEALLDLCAATSPDLVVLSGELLAVLPEPVAWIERWLGQLYNPAQPPVWLPEDFLYLPSGTEAAALGLCSALMDEDLQGGTF
ncbi:MAG: ROK family protein [Spirochaetales bacterium]